MFGGSLLDDAVAAAMAEDVPALHRVGEVAGTVLLCTDVTEGTRTKGDHKERILDVVVSARKLVWKRFDVKGGLPLRRIRVVLFTGRSRA